MFPQNTKFLVVDDFATMRNIIKTALLELGYADISEAENGETALILLRKAQSRGQPIEVIVSDTSMPILSGLDLLKTCRRDPLLKSTPFLLITAESDQKNILEAAHAGVSDCLVKPFDASVLGEKLQRIFTKHHAKSTG